MMYNTTIQLYDKVFHQNLEKGENDDFNLCYLHWERFFDSFQLVSFIKSNQWIHLLNIIYPSILSLFNAQTASNAFGQVLLVSSSINLMGHSLPNFHFLQF